MTARGIEYCFVTPAALVNLEGQITALGASARLGSLAPTRALTKLGYDARTFSVAGDPAPAEAAVRSAGRIVFGELFANRGGWGAAVAAYRRLLGLIDDPRSRAIFSIADDHFDDAEFRAFYERVLLECLAVTTVSEHLAQKLRMLTSRPVFVAPEPYEGARATPQAFVPRRPGGLLRWVARRIGLPLDLWRLRLLWFGYPMNLRSLLEMAPSLEEFARQQPLLLTCVTNSVPEITALITPERTSEAAALRVRFVQWTPLVMDAALAGADVVLVPSEYRNPIKQAKSPNRLVAGLHAGRFVVAHPVPAYAPYAEFAWVGEDLCAGLDWAVRHPREVVDRIARGQAYIDERHSPEVVARFWLDVFHPKDRPQAALGANAPRAQPPVPEASTLLAIFDLGWYAPTFDIFEFALNARMWAQRRGFARVKLVILKRPFSEALRLQPQLPNEYDFRLHDLLLNSAAQLPVDDVELTSDVAATAAAANADHVYPPGWRRDLAPQYLAEQRYYLERFLRDQMAAGEPIPGIRIPPTAYKRTAALLRGRARPWISITVRETPHGEARNSNLRTWRAVGEHFERRGASVIVLSDVESQSSAAAAAPLAAMAMANLSYRAALNDACDLNLGVAGGGVASCLFNPSAVYVITKFGTEGSTTSQARMMELFGLGPGSEMFYRVPWQRSLWENDDDPQRLIAQAEEMLELSARLRAEIQEHPHAGDPWGKPDGTLHGLWPSGQPGVSQARIESAMTMSPYSCKPWLRDAEQYLAKGEYSEALRCANNAIRLDGRYQRAYEIAAQCLNAVGQPKLAERMFGTAQSLLPPKK